MSLLLDALKKAAEDKKNKTGDKPGKGSDEEDLNLDLDIDESSNFPAADENIASKTVEQQSASGAEQDSSESLTEAVEDTVKDSSNKQSGEPQAETPATEDTQQPIAATSSPQAEPEIPASEIPADVVVKQSEPETEPESESEPEPELEMSIDQIIEKDRTQQDKEVLTYLIHKSNQASDGKKRRSRIIYGTLAGVILLVLVIFSYLKLLVVSEQLYTGKPIETTERRRPPEPKPLPAPVVDVSEPKPAVEPIKSAEPAASVDSKASVNTPAVVKPSNIATASRQSQPQAINIIHKKVVDPTDTYLRDAYRLFNAGEYDQARQLYLRVLQIEPKNRDALLGVAAVDVKQEHFETARQRYSYLLHLNPKDSIARAGLSAMPSQVDAIVSESQLKLMLREQPEAAHLYFALGNLYASTDRWGEAQSVFFSAWSAESENADYAFNLAVSLDHLGKYKQALEFYRKSLLLSKGRSANTSPEAIKKRIDFLQAPHE